MQEPPGFVMSFSDLSDSLRSDALKEKVDDLSAQNEVRLLEKHSREAFPPKE